MQHVILSIEYSSSFLCARMQQFLIIFFIIFRSYFYHQHFNMFLKKRLNINSSNQMCTVFLMSLTFSLGSTMWDQQLVQNTLTIIYQSECIIYIVAELKKMYSNASNLFQYPCFLICFTFYFRKKYPYKKEIQLLNWTKNNTITL